LTWIITIVGEEAMAVYSRRDINTYKVAFERDLAFAMVDMARAHENISKEAHEMVLDHVLNKARLSDGLRVTVLRALMANGPQDMFVPKGVYTEKQKKRILENVNRVAAAGGGLSPESRSRLQALTRALEIGSSKDPHA
jgi:hypothetical protein